MRQEKTSFFEFGDFKVRSSEFFLDHAGRTIPVEPTPFRVLLCLLENSGRLVTKDEIVKDVWSDCSVSDNSLTRCVATLRRLLGDDSREPRYIATVSKIGYRFCCPVAVSREHFVPGPASNDAIPAVLGMQFVPFVDSIAVLPFASPDFEEDAAYLGDGISIGIIDCLSHLTDVWVVPRTTVSKYRCRLADPAAAAREMGARLVVSGSVEPRAGSFNLNVQLTDAVNLSLLWEARMIHPDYDHFAILSEVVFQIAGHLTIPLDAARRRQLGSRPTSSREAYLLYLKAMHWATKFTLNGIRKGIEFIRQAIDADPTYAQAWAGLAHIFTMIGFVDGTAYEAFPKAKAASVRALEIDNDDAEAHAALGLVRLVYEWDWPGAYAEMLRALELRPNLSVCHFTLSQWYLTQGLFDEALGRARFALELDPLSALFSFNVGWILLLAGQKEAAIGQLEKTIEFEPSFSAAHQMLAAAYAERNMRVEALSALEQGFRNTNEPTRTRAFRGLVGALTGNWQEAIEALDSLLPELIPPAYSSAYHCALLHSLLGQKDEAFACLEMARQGHSNRIAFLAVAPNFGNLRGDPRFLDLLARIGIPTRRFLATHQRQ